MDNSTKAPSRLRMAQLGMVLVLATIASLMASARLAAGRRVVRGDGRGWQKPATAEPSGQPPPTAATSGTWRVFAALVIVLCAFGTLAAHGASPATLVALSTAAVGVLAVVFKRL